MPSASQLFYLAVFALFGPVRGETHGSKSLSQARSSSACAIDPKATVSDACASFATLDELNHQIAPLVRTITQDTDFFSYYRLNLFNKQCPFWSDDSGMCGNIACAVTTLDNEDDIPPVWRSEELSKLEGPKAGHPGKKLQEERPKDKPLQGMLGEGVGETCVVEYDDECDARDYCVPEDEGATAKGDYVSLLDNPERFTGYSGAGARQVWDAIYRENCFLKKPLQSTSSTLFSPGNMQAAKDFRNVLEKHDREQVVSAVGRDGGYPLDDECLEKRVFHRIISGMHASISTHLCWDYFNQTTGEWLPNVECYRARLHDYPERISNIYFDFAVLVRAVAKIRKHLENYTYCVSDPKQDYETKEKVLKLADTVASRPQIFDESILFQDDVANGLKEDIRNRFRNVSRLMDCIGCDKCRLWGKLQTAGYGAALKILFEYDETKDGENPPLRRTELVALINTLGRVSKSLVSVHSFERAIEAGTETALPVHTKVPPTPTGSAGKVKESSSTPIARAEKGSRAGGGGASDDAFSDDDYEDDAKPTKRPATLEEEFWEEFYLVWRTFAYVLKSWIYLPKTLWDISISELNRLWSFWLGLPVQPRSWNFHIPTRDEL
ncbi:hypothetical protein AJ80_05238 [Polytolypa hystricis UAMH7299]|uniref:Endoplasmic oxidoreductin-1 n=1 Tax=Polytolypa hystricis (strain UAMH7299) TaxID=1447883 RepID=A0A2B7Y683_POLH7|nr:hypothetical protein AJ80_05238 [Polytolypa hystricis UAMH7299]